MADDAQKLHSANLPYREREINDRPYRVDRFGWWEVQDTIESLTEVLGPSVEGLLDGESLDLTKILDAPGGKVGEAIVGALRRAVAKKGPGRALMEKLGAQTMVVDDADGEKESRRLRLSRGIMDVWFSRYPADAIPWLLFALEVQVGDFFAPLLARMKPARGLSESGDTEEGPEETAEEPRSPNT